MKGTYFSIPVPSYCCNCGSIFTFSINCDTRYDYNQQNVFSCANCGSLFVQVDEEKDMKVCIKQDLNRYWEDEKHEIRNARISISG